MNTRTPRNRTPGSYRKNEFACGNDKCDGFLIPVRITKVPKEENARVEGTCPSCKKSYSFTLPLGDTAEVDAWSAVVKKLYPLCTSCGEEALKLVKVEGRFSKDRDITVECVACQKREERYMDAAIYPMFEKSLPPKERLSIQCGNCGYFLHEEHHCPKCGQEIFCDKCYAYIPPKATTCARCGDPVKQGDPSMRK